MQWVVSGVALAVALLAWVRTRSVLRKVDRLTQQYWELRYQHGLLKARVDRIDPEAQADREAPTPTAAAQTFIPLSSLKR